MLILEAKNDFFSFPFFLTRRKSLNSSPVQDVALFLSRNVLLKPLPGRMFGMAYNPLPFQGEAHLRAPKPELGH